LFRTFNKLTFGIFLGKHILTFFSIQCIGEAPKSVTTATSLEQLETVCQIDVKNGCIFRFTFSVESTNNGRQTDLVQFCAIQLE